MHFSKLCAELGIPRDEIATVLGIEQRLAHAIDGGKAAVEGTSLENARLRLQARAGKPVDATKVLRAMQSDQLDSTDAPVPAEVVEWERAANEEWEANRDNALEYLAEKDVHVGLRSPRGDLWLWIVRELEKKGAHVHSGIGSVGRIRLRGYSVKVPPP